MANCVYCGNKIDEVRHSVKVLRKDFSVCSSECSEKAKGYVNLDKQYKKFMYLGIFIPCIIILINLMFSNSMKIVYSMQALVGIVFCIFPYPNTYFNTFSTMSIKSVKRICRILGFLFFVLGLYLAINI